MDRILLESKKVTLGLGRGLLLDSASIIDQIFPSAWLDWDPSTNQCKEVLDNFHQARLGGLKAAARKPTNLSKVSEVTQTTHHLLGSWVGRGSVGFTGCSPP